MCIRDSLYMVRWGGMEPWLGIDHLRFGIIGCAVNLVVMIVVSLATEEPDEATRRWLMKSEFRRVKPFLRHLTDPVN